MTKISYVFSAVFYMAMSSIALGEIIKNDKVGSSFAQKAFNNRGRNFVFSASALLNTNAEKFGVETTFGGRFDLTKVNDRLSVFISPEVMYRYIPMSLKEKEVGSYLLDQHYNKIEKTLTTQDDVKYIPKLTLTDNENLDPNNLLQNVVSLVINEKTKVILDGISALKTEASEKIEKINEEIVNLNTSITSKEEDFKGKSQAYDDAQKKYYDDIKIQQVAETIMNGGTGINLTNDADKANTKGLMERIAESEMAYSVAAQAMEQAVSDYEAKAEAFNTALKTRDMRSDEATQAQIDLDTKKTEIKSLETEIGQIRENLLKQSDYITEARNAYDSATTEEEKNTLFKQLADLVFQEQSLDESVQKKVADKNALEGTLEGLKETLQQKKDAYSEAKKNYDEAKTAKDQAEAVKNEAISRETAAKNEYDSLKNTGDAVNNIIDNAKATNADNEEAVKKAKEARDTAQNDLIAATNDRNDKQGQILTIKNELINVLSNYNSTSFEGLEDKIKEKLGLSSTIYMRENLEYSSTIQHMAFTSVRIGLTMDGKIKFSPYVRPMIGVLLTNNSVYGSRDYILKIEGDENYYGVGSKKVEEGRKLASFGYGVGIGVDYHFKKHFFVNVEYSFVRSSFDAMFKSEGLEKTMSHNLHFVKVGFGVQF